ncbi:TIGR02611 family protein [Curtobacterium sp. RRHDQ10]|uniref:TIGR02611 family protein n=1 Tax=Curtobacterium phyllosphaerae TaxID=3413379 RepID=UPI003BEFC134
MDDDDDEHEGRAVRSRFRWFRDVRAWIHARPHVHLPYRILVGIVGGLIVVIGLILVPLPGPGWLIVFIGLTVLASEFAFFSRISAWLRVQLHRFWDWVRRHGTERMRAAADRGKSSVDDAHADATRSVGTPPAASVPIAPRRPAR